MKGMRSNNVVDPVLLLSGSGLSKARQRELLASWMSDIHAVRDHPALRRTSDGILFHIDDLADALRKLDEFPTPAAIIPFPRPRPRDDGPPGGAAAMRPMLPPVVIDARAGASRSLRRM